MKTVKGQKIARLLLLTTMFSSLAFAGPKKTSPIILSLDEIRAAQEQISIVSKQTTDRNAVASLIVAQDRLLAAQVLLKEVVSGIENTEGTQSRTRRKPIDRRDNFRPSERNDSRFHPAQGKLIKLYNSDNCNKDLLGSVGRDMNCSNFEKDVIWAVSVDGKCLNITDVRGTAFCQNYPAIHEAKSLEIYEDDYCRKDLIAMIDETTDCDTLSGSRRAWGIKVNGACQNINDMPLKSACERFKSLSITRSPF